MGQEKRDQLLGRAAIARVREEISKPQSDDKTPHLCHLFEYGHVVLEPMNYGSHKETDEFLIKLALRRFTRDDGAVIYFFPQLPKDTITRLNKTAP